MTIGSKYTDRQLEDIAKMGVKGWTFIDFEDMLKLVKSDMDVLFTSKGPFLYYKVDNNAHV